MMCSTPPKKYKLSSDILADTNGRFSGFSSSMSEESHYPLSTSSSAAASTTPTSLTGRLSNASSSSPPPSGHSQSWRVRRSSFLSEKMMHEDHNSYEVGIAEDGSTRYNLSVKESQGFQWNPDLFVSKFHQQDYYHYSSNSYHNNANSSSSTGEQFNDHSRPSVQDIVIDTDEDIFPSDY